jgi:hypothetical protein
MHRGVPAAGTDELLVAVDSQHAKSFLNFATPTTHTASAMLACLSCCWLLSLCWLLIFVVLPVAASLLLAVSSYISLPCLLLCACSVVLYCHMWQGWLVMMWQGWLLVMMWQG